MNINIAQNMNYFNFEKGENLRNTAKDILSRQGASKENLERIFAKSVFKEDATVVYPNAQLAVLKASSQITQSTTLKETLKYLKEQAVKKSKKTHVLGEFWDLFNENNDEYSGELADFEINFNKNIFVAA